MKKLISIILICIILIFNGCIRNKVTSSVSNRNYLICSIGEFPDSLEFVTKESSCYNFMLENLFEGLVSLEDGNNINPEIAEKWTVSKDGLEYVFDIRQDAKWNDGTNIKAKDLENFFKEILSKKSSNPYAYELYCIFGAENYSKGIGSFDNVAIKAIDENKLQIRLNEPCADFLKILTQPAFTVRMDSAVLNLWKDNYKNIKYSGAFEISNIGKDGIVLEKNPNYWNRQGVTDEKFLIIDDDDKEEALASFESDKINILVDPPVSEVGRLISNDSTIVVNSPDIIGVSFNFSGNRPVGDINTRRKIFNALDGEEIAEKKLEEYSLSGTNIFESNAFTPNKIRDAQAKDIEDASSLALNLLAEDNDVNKRIAKGIAQQIKDKLKIKVNLNLVEQDEFNEAVQDNDFDLLLDTIHGDYAGEKALYKRFISNNSLNYGKYKNSAYDALVKKAVYSVDSTAVNASIKNCEDSLRNDCVFVPLFHNVNVIIRSSNVEAIKVSHYGNIKLNEIHEK